MKITTKQIAAIAGIVGGTFIGTGIANVVSKLNKEKKLKTAYEHYNAVLMEHTKDYTPEEMADWLRRSSDAREAFFNAIVNL